MAFLPPSYTTLNIGAWLIGKFGIASGFLSLYVYASEVFPTVARNACMGFFSLMARLSGALAPIIPTLAAEAAWLPSVTFAVVSTGSTAGPGGVDIARDGWESVAGPS